MSSIRVSVSWIKYSAKFGSYDKVIDNMTGIIKGILKNLQGDQDICRKDAGMVLGQRTETTADDGYTSVHISGYREEIRAMADYRIKFAKIEIRGILEVVTGLYIGGGNAYAASKTVDLPIIKDPRDGLPMIPGSSLKGKLRTVLAHELNESMDTPDRDDARIRSLFGNYKDGEIKAGRLSFSDMLLGNADKLESSGRKPIELSRVLLTEPGGRQKYKYIESISRGAEYELSLIYETDKDVSIEDDFRLITEGLRLIQKDHLGGNGAAGFGRVRFRELKAETVAGEADEQLIEQCNKLLKEV